MGKGSRPAGNRPRNEAPQPPSKRRGGRRARAAPPPPERSAPGRDGRHYADAVIFVAIMVVAAFLAYALIPVAFAGQDARNDRDLGDWATNTNQVLLGSTVPVCTYSNSRNVATQYNDARVHYLLSEDLYIRTEGKKDLNLGSLRGGIEKNAAELAGRLIPEEYGFVITVTLQKDGQGFCVLRQSPGAQTVYDADLNHQIIKDILNSKNGRSYRVQSEFRLRNDEVCVITFAVFASGAYDTGPLGGG